MEVIKVKPTRALFVTRQGVPKKNYLKTLPGIYEASEISISNNKIERSYQMRIGYGVIASIRKFFRIHHCNFIDWKPGKGELIEHGFTSDKDKIENSVERYKKIADIRRKSARIASNLANEQLQLEF